MLREGGVNPGEAYGIMDFNWVRPKNPSFIERLQLARQINQVEDPGHLASYKMFNPQTGLCPQVGKITFSYPTATPRLDGFDTDGGPLKLGGTTQKCLTAAGDGVAAALVSTDCTSSSSMWEISSISKLPLAAQVAPGKYLCLEKNAADSTIVTKECICLQYAGEARLVDITPSCFGNPQTVV